MTQTTHARSGRAGGSSDQVVPAADLNALLGEGHPERSQALARRVKTVLTTLGVPSPVSTGPALLTALDRSIDEIGLSAAWLALAVLTGRLPVTADVHRLVRATRLDGALPALVAALHESGQLAATTRPGVEVVTGRVLGDVDKTART